MTRFKSALRSSAEGARSSPPGTVVPCPPAHSAKPAKRIALKFQCRIGKSSQPKAVLHQIHFSAAPLHGDARVLGWQTGWRCEAGAGSPAPAAGLSASGSQTDAFFRFA